MTDYRQREIAEAYEYYYERARKLCTKRKHVQGLAICLTMDAIANKDTDTLWKENLVRGYVELCKVCDPYIRATAKNQARILEESE